MSAISSKYRNLLIFLFLALILSPIYSYYFGSIFNLNFWMIGGLIYNVLLIREITLEYINRKILIIIIIYTFLYAIFESFTDVVLLQYFLFLVSFNVFVTFIFISRTKSISLLPTINFFFYLICFYAIYQFIGNFINLPFTGENIYRGRAFERYNQVTSFFEEPAFLSLYLISMLYIYLFFEIKGRISKIFLIVITLSLSMSLSGLVSMLILIFTFLILKFKDSFKIKSFKSVITFFLIIMVVSIFVFKDNNIKHYISNRFHNEVIVNFENIGANPTVNPDERLSSGGIRIVQEINYFIYTLKKSPLFGFGLGYESKLNRTMALNAIVEIIIRWGIIGLIFFILFYRNIYNKSNKFNISFYIFLILFIFTDGAISKVQFWMYLGLVYYISIHHINLLDKGKKIITNI